MVWRKFFQFFLSWWKKGKTLLTFGVLGNMIVLLFKTGTIILSLYQLKAYFKFWGDVLLFICLKFDHYFGLSSLSLDKL